MTGRPSAAHPAVTGRPSAAHPAVTGRPSAAHPAVTGRPSAAHPAVTGRPSAAVTGHLSDPIVLPSRRREVRMIAPGRGSATTKADPALRTAARVPGEMSDLPTGRAVVGTVHSIRTFRSGRGRPRPIAVTGHTRVVATTATAASVVRMATDPPSRIGGRSLAASAHSSDASRILRTPAGRSAPSPEQVIARSANLSGFRQTSMGAGPCWSLCGQETSSRSTSRPG